MFMCLNRIESVKFQNVKYEFIDKVKSLLSFLSERFLRRECSTERATTLVTGGEKNDTTVVGDR